jgi:hypothetical protein
MLHLRIAQKIDRILRLSARREGRAKRESGE